MLGAATGRTALALALAAGALTLSACGDDEGGTIPKDNADALLAQVETLQQDVDSGQCSLAAGAVDRLHEGVDGLPKDVGVETKSDLFDLVDRLENLVATQCQEADTGASGTTGAAGPTETTPSPTPTATEDEPETDTEPPPEQPSDEGTGVPGGGNQGNGNGNGNGGTSGGTEG